MSPIVTCTSCNHRFAVSNTFIDAFATCPHCGAMIMIDKPDPAGEIPMTSVSATVSAAADRHRSFLRAQLPIAGVIVVMVSLLQLALTGPQFLVALGVSVLAAIGCVTAASKKNGEKLAAVILWVFAIELVGVIRLAYGMSQGMHRFQILYAVLITVPFVLGIVAMLQSVSWDMGAFSGYSGYGRSSHSSSGFGGSSCSSGGSASSCGGGGCDAVAGVGEEVVVVAVAETPGLIEVPLTGLGYRAPLADWISSRPPEVHCLEITAEHFFDHGEEHLEWLSECYPLYVHGLGLSLGTPGRLDADTLDKFARIASIAGAEWISEHVAFTRSDEVDLGHLNPVAPTESSLSVLVDHARELMDRCQKPLILENVTSFLRLPGEMSETEFLNRLCERSGCGLLLDVTNLLINARNHRFDELDWLSELDSDNVVQLHVVGYSEQNGVWQDYHGAAIQDDLFHLVGEVVRSTSVRAIIIERDTHFPPDEELARELTRLENECVSARQSRELRDV